MSGLSRRSLSRVSRQITLFACAAFLTKCKAKAKTTLDHP